MADLRQSTSQVIRFGPFLDSTDMVTPETGLTITQADMQLSKDGAVFAQKNASGNATHDVDGWYSTTLDSTDTATASILELQVTVAGAVPYHKEFNVLTAIAYDTNYTENNILATAEQVGNISLGSAAQGQNATGATITTGTQTLTYTATEQVDGVLHEVADDAGNTDFYYTTTLAGNASATAIQWRGYVQSNADTVQMQLYNWLTLSYKTEKILTGSNSTTLVDESIPMISAYTGTGANIGEVRFRFLSTTTTNIATDRLIFEYTTVVAESGFDGGMVWVDTVNGVAGTAKGIGIATNPVSNLTDAITIAAANNLYQFYFAPESIFAPAGDFNNYNVYGIGYTATLGGHDYAGTHIYHASPVSGIATSQNNSDHFDVLDSIVVDVTVDDAHFTNCSFKGTITLDQVNSGDLRIIGSRSIIAGSSTPVVDCGTAAVTHDITIGDYYNGIEIRNLNNGGVNLFSMAATGKLVAASTCSGAMNVRGPVQVVDNSGGNVIFVYDDIHTDVQATLVDTGITLPAQISALNNISTADILSSGDVDGFSIEESLKLTVASQAGKTSGGATTTFVVRAVDDSKARITATVDADGNRSAVTTDVSG